MKILASEMPQLSKEVKKWFYENHELGKKSSNYRDFNSRLWQSLYRKDADGKLYIKNIKLANELLQKQYELTDSISEDVQKFMELVKAIKEKGKKKVVKVKRFEVERERIEAERTDDEYYQDSQIYDDDDGIWSPSIY